jgi:hypothetical protein
VLAKLRARLTYANVVATLALFVALGGSSYAAVKVTGKNVRDSSLTGKDIRNGTISGRDVKNSSLAGRDVKNNSLTGSDIKESSLGTVPRAGDANTVGGQSAAQLGLRAYGHVNKDGTLDPSRSKGIASVSNDSQDNVYCFDLGFTPKIVIGTSGDAFKGYIVSSLPGDPSGVGCPAGTDAVVYTSNDQGSGAAATFDVLFE